MPADAPEPYRRHPRYGAPSRRWPYLDASGGLLGYVCRFDAPEGKQYRPLTLHRDAGGSLKWAWEAWTDPRPLYGLDRLAARPGAPVVLCEGEKSADAAGELLPGHVAVCSPNGAQAAGHADWSPLRGRAVTIWRDADDPGMRYEREAIPLIFAAGALSLARIEPPAGVCEGWDAANIVEDGLPPDLAIRLVGAASPIERPAPPPPQARAEGRAATRRRASAKGAQSDGGGKSGRERISWEDVMMSLTADYHLWHNPKKVAYASVPMNAGHRENVRINSSSFQQRLRLAAYEQTSRIPPADTIKDVSLLLEAQAITHGECFEEWRRVGKRDDKLYLDLGCKGWRVVEISPAGQRIVSGDGLPFVRPDIMQALPDPVFGEENGIHELRRFVNVDSDADFLLIVAWLFGALCLSEEYPLLIINGEQGTGKSTMSRLLRSIVDPSSAPLLGPPKEPRDLFVLAQHAHLAAFDNLSKVDAWLSDCLCVFATGGAVANRSMYTDEEISILSALRPVILNGIPALAERPDLAQRGVAIRLKPVAAEERRTAADIKADWEKAHPRILGALLEGLSRGLQDIDRIKLDKLPRMAQFAKFFTASAPGSGLDGQEMLAAYMTMQTDLADMAFENDIVAQAIVRMMEGNTSGEWIGTATDLLAALSHPDVTPERVTNSLTWPRKAQAIGSMVTRIAPALRARGIDATRQHSGKTLWTIRRLG